jgi:hypothetical protein
VESVQQFLAFLASLLALQQAAPFEQTLPSAQAASFEQSFFAAEQAEAQAVAQAAFVVVSD